MLSLVLILLLVSGSVITALSVLALHRGSSKLVMYFGVSMLLAAVWNFGFAAEIISTTLEGKIFWANIQFMGIAFLPAAWLLMSICAAGHLRATLRPMLALSVIPFVTNILIWTDPWHHLFHGVPELVSTGVPFPVLSNDYGVYFYAVHAPYGYLLFAAALVVLLRGMRKQSGIYQRQIRALIVSVILPLAVDLLYVLGVSPIQGFNFSSITFSIAGVILSLNITRNQFLDLLPQAYDAAVHEMQVGLIVLDKEERITELNPAAETLTGVVRKTVVGSRLDDALPFLKPDEAEESIYTEVNYLHEGRKLTIALRRSLITGGRGSVIGSVLTLNDVTERAELLDEVERLSITDPLTGALNRRALEEMGRSEIHRAYRYHHDLSMVLLDVDNFKEINDTHGHPCGDEFLKMIVGSIRKSIRSTDMVFRYGGDEFILLLVETNPARALETAERIRGELQNLRVGTAEEATTAIRVSIGVTGLASNDTPEKMMHRADSALYRAKQEGKDRIEIF